MVPEKVRLLLDFRILPNMSHDEVIKILKSGLKEQGIEGYELVPHFLCQVEKLQCLIRLCHCA
mgnify:CR=1 FL=1